LKVIDHYQNPRNVGSLDKKSSDVGTGLVGAPACGDVMKLQVRKTNFENVSSFFFVIFFHELFSD
jgi:nitrogen fixation NifU-like protein